LTSAIFVIESQPDERSEAAMATNKTPIRIVLSKEERDVLEDVARSFGLPHRDVLRAKVILLLADGTPVSEVGRRVELQRRIVRKWADRFVRKRLRGLDDAPRRGRPPLFSPSGGDVPR
jgi:winged helix-turn helix protein